MRGFDGQRLCGVAVVLAAALPGCAVTSPHWGYVPASTDAAIPVQAWTAYTDNPVVVECATATSAHGSPTPDESAYIVAANLPVSSADIRDSENNVMHSASGNITMPSSCWDYFGDYDFWQINLRISQVQPNTTGGGTTKRIFSSFDLDGLECLGRENGAAASFYGFVGRGCEKTYLGESTQIPYIVLRIDGYENGLARDLRRATPFRPRKSPSSVNPDELQKDAPRVTPIIPLTLDEVERIEKVAAPH
ncbi:MAG TPA: hypothetical protein VMG12_16560 [Polyangiaceae bacterium]|nr:hypothetical protein [Polyangiaceae bacterium]